MGTRLGFDETVRFPTARSERASVGRDVPPQDESRQYGQTCRAVSASSRQASRTETVVAIDDDRAALRATNAQLIHCQQASALATRTYSLCLLADLESMFGAPGAPPAGCGFVAEAQT